MNEQHPEQQYFPIESEDGTIDPVFPPSPEDVGDAVSEIDLLRAQFVEIENRVARYDRVRQRITEQVRKCRLRTAIITEQIKALEKNPEAVLRYRSRLPEWNQASAWYNQPIEVLRLDSLPGLGVRRLAILSACCPTIGDLEIQRVNVGISDIDGISRGTAQKIEVRLLKWIKKHASNYSIKPSYEDWTERHAKTYPKTIPFGDR